LLIVQAETGRRSGIFGPDDQLTDGTPDRPGGNRPPAARKPPRRSRRTGAC
jgi:hypothetical protein